MNAKEIVEQFEIKDNATVEGITADYVWYNSELLKKKISTWIFDFDRVVKVMEARHNEHLQIIAELLRKNKELSESVRRFNLAAVLQPDGEKGVDQHKDGD